MNDKNSTKDEFTSSSATRQRPNSSRFPPLTTQTGGGHSFHRSASFDYSFSNCNRDTKTDHHIRGQSFDQNSNDNNFYSNSVESILEFNASKEYSVNQSDNELCSRLSSEKAPVLTIRTDHCYVEYQRLKKENQILKQNFLRMSKIIQKHSRLMTRKDEVILKLQEKNANRLPQIAGHQSCDTKSTDIHGSDGMASDVMKAFTTSQQLQTKSTELSQTIANFCHSFELEFGQQLSQFDELIAEIQLCLDNNNSKQFSSNSNDGINALEAKLHQLSADYTELHNNYEILCQQNIISESFIEYVINICGVEYKEGLNKTQTTDNLRQILAEEFAKNHTIADESETLKERLRAEEEYIYALIDGISEIELELELLGRNPDTIVKLIDKFRHTFDAFKLKTHISSTYFESLNSILIQIYKNQIKWLQLLGQRAHSPQTPPPDITGTEDNTTDEDTSDSVLQTYCQTTSNSLSVEKTIVMQSSDCSVDGVIDTCFDDFTDDSAFDEFDIESINRILMAKQYDSYSLVTNLEVVNEEDEEQVEEQSVDGVSDDSYADSDVFEELATSFKQELNVCDNNGHNWRDIQSTVESIITQMLDKIEDNISVEEYSKTMAINEKNETQIMAAIVDSVVEMTPIEAMDNEANDTPLSEDKPQNIDSDFVSECNCSSPDTTTVDTIKEQTICFDTLSQSDSVTNVFEPVHSPSAIMVSNPGYFGELKQLNARQSSELYIAKTRIKELETQLSVEQNDGNSGGQQHNQRYLSDELQAWKELVVQQKAIMEKIRRELEFQQMLNTEKDKTIDKLKNTFAERNDSESQCSVERSSHFENTVTNDNVDNDSDDGLDLNGLFNSEELETHDMNDGHQNTRQTTSTVTTIDGEVVEVEVECDDNSADEAVVRCGHWNHTENKMRAHSDNRNYRSDESTYSYGTVEKSSPVSMPDELLSPIRRKVFIPYSHEEVGVRRHSCQDRVIRYGSHPRKRRLELKNVDIVFSQQNENSNKISNKRLNH